MCLLDGVLAWDEKTIHAISDGHARADNPLRGEHGLHTVHLAEYGAQAMAVHGALLARADGVLKFPFVCALWLFRGKRSFPFRVLSCSPCSAAGFGFPPAGPILRARLA